MERLQLQNDRIIPQLTGNGWPYDLISLGKKLSWESKLKKIKKKVNILAKRLIFLLIPWGWPAVVGFTTILNFHQRSSKFDPKIKSWILYYAISYSWECNISQNLCFQLNFSFPKTWRKLLANNTLHVKISIQKHPQRGQRCMALFSCICAMLSQITELSNILKTKI